MTEMEFILEKYIESNNLLLIRQISDHKSIFYLSRGQDVLKEVEAMRQYQENIENLNEIAHQRPRAHLVLGKN